MFCRPNSLMISRSLLCLLAVLLLVICCLLVDIRKVEVTMQWQLINVLWGKLQTSPLKFTVLPLALISFASYDLRLLTSVCHCMKRTFTGSWNVDPNKLHHLGWNTFSAMLNSLSTGWGWWGRIARWWGTNWGKAGKFAQRPFACIWSLQLMFLIIDYICWDR